MKNISQIPKQEQGLIYPLTEWEIADPDTVTRKVLVAMKRAAEIIKWRKKTQKKVFYAHLKMAWEANSLTYHASFRQLAEQARVETETARKATLALVQDQLLSISQKSKKGTVVSNEYTLQAKKSQHDIFRHYFLVCLGMSYEGSQPELPDRPEPDWSFEVIRQDCFRGGVSWECDRFGEPYDIIERLGPTGGEVFKELLHKQMQSADELAEVVFCNRRTIERALKKLMQYGMVEKIINTDPAKNCKYVYKADPNYHFYDVELATKTLGKTSQKKKQYEREREQYKRSLKDPEYKEIYLQQQRAVKSELIRKSKVLSQRRKARKERLERK